VVQDARFILVILDNSTTAMTGNQPTPAIGIGACGDATCKISIEEMVKSCGVNFCKVGNPYLIPEFTSLIKEAREYSHTHGPAVVIARYPCVMDKRQKESRLPAKPVYISETCDGCKYCIKEFECPALEFDGKGNRVNINAALCNGCGVCVSVCPKKSINLKE
jgi:indolepyruvate ferredoxin oxidoreductase alpha subunit